MPDVGTQLREYFDETVERMTEEDIRIRATTARGVPVRGPRFRVRPVAAVSVSFGLALTLIGGVMVASKFLGGDQGDVAGNGLPGPSTAVDSGSPWILLWLMAGFGLLAFGMWSMRRSSDDVRERGDETMQTIERPGAAQASPGDTKLKSRNRMLTWLVGILAVAVIGLGAWLVAEMSASSDTGSLPAEVEAVLDDYITAWETTDSDLFRATTTEDFTFIGNSNELNRATQAFWIGQGHFAIEIDSTTATGDGPYYVGQSGRVQVNVDGPWHDGQWMYKITEIDGAWKVEHHSWIGDV